MADNNVRIVRKHIEPETKSVGFVEKDGQDLLRVPISSTSQDRDGDEFSKDGLERQLEQLKSGTVKMYPNHGDVQGFDMPYPFQHIMGKWVDGEIEDNTLFGFAQLRENNDDADELKDLVEQDMPVGFSVGFGVPEGAASETTDGMQFDDADLMEVSAVGIESNPDAVVGASMAMAKAFDNAGVEPDENLIKELTDAIKNMTEEEKDEPTDEVEQTEEQSKEGDKDDEEYEDKEPEAKFSDDEVSEIMGVVGGVVESHMEALTTDIRDNLMDADGEENSADTEETEESDEDEDEEMSADVKALVDTVEDQKDTIGELKAKVESLESKSREPGDKKGMVPAEKEEQTEETKGKEAPEDFYANLA